MPKNKEMCFGCRDNFYNDNNNLGVEGCFNFPTAIIKLRKKVHRDHVPPWDHKPAEMLSCYHADGFIVVEGDRKY